MWSGHTVYCYRLNEHIRNWKNPIWCIPSAHTSRTKQLCQQAFQLQFSCDSDHLSGQTVVLSLTVWTQHDTGTTRHWANQNAAHSSTGKWEVTRFSKSDFSDWTKVTMSRRIHRIQLNLCCDDHNVLTALRHIQTAGTHTSVFPVHLSFITSCWCQLLFLHFYYHKVKIEYWRRLCSVVFTLWTSAEET